MDPQKSYEQYTFEIAEAFERLSILAEQSDYLKRYIQFLVERMSEISHLPYPNNFIKKPAVVTDELEQLLGKTIDLEHYLSQIHQSTIFAIPDLSARSNLQTACQQMIVTVNDALQSLSASSKDQPLNTGGRPPKFRALDLAKSLAGNYWQLTGKPPTILVDPIGEGHQAQGDFLRLVDDIFGILEIEGSPEYFTKRAIEDFNHQKEKTSP